MRSRRCEGRKSQNYAVTLLGVEAGTREVTVTKDVSSKGACVLSGHRWLLTDFINLRCHQYTFLGLARVVWCRNGKGRSYTLGLEFLYKSGTWLQAR